ncbi:MAG: glucose-6-phosphate isomerase [Verrucomicrobiales bacterium]
MSHWERFQDCFLRYEDLGISLDISRMNFDGGFLDRMAPLCQRAFMEMRRLEAGEIVNADEDRMVGHYWLRNSNLAPTPELRAGIEQDIANSKAFAAEVHGGRVTPQRGGKFTRLLVIGIGGSALGPQLVADALIDDWKAPVRTHFFDNTDPEGIGRVLAEIGDDLERTLTIVVSKSGGTPETRNGMLAAQAGCEDRGLNFAKHAVAITGPGSKLDEYARNHAWLRVFPMTDWVGGRTSVMSTVGLVPMAIQGVDIDAFLRGAAAVDEKTRSLPVRENISMLLALMWHWAGAGKGAKDMVILPYKDRLALFSRYLQQLVMESLGKEQDRDGGKVNQGIAVYGNKGSTDQHAYVQQLRDGVNNFFATFIEVRKPGGERQIEVDPGVTPGDYLQGFLRGTRRALYENGRESVTLSVPSVDPFSLGGLIAVFERAVGFYASLVNINAYHQPGVEAGKKAATIFLKLLKNVRGTLNAKSQNAEQIATQLEADAEDVWHCLNHLAASDKMLTRIPGPVPGSDAFAIKEK